MDIPEELRSPKAILFACGALGSAFAAASIKDAPWWQRALMFAFGGVTAALFGPPLIAFVNAPGGWGNAISFLVGYIGWALMGKLVSTIREADLWNLVSDIARSWLERR